MTSMNMIDELEDRLNDNPKSLLFARLADFYLKSGRIDDAIHLCRQGIKYNPSYVAGHFIMGKALIAAGDHEKAESSFKKVISHDRQYLAAHKLLGDIMARMGWENKAAVHYRDLLQIDPMEEEAREMLRSFSFEEDNFSVGGSHETAIDKFDSDFLGKQKETAAEENWVDDPETVLETGEPDIESGLPIEPPDETSENMDPAVQEDLTSELEQETGTKSTESSIIEEDESILSYRSSASEKEEFDFSAFDEKPELDRGHEAKQDEKTKTGESDTGSIVSEDAFETEAALETEEPEDKPAEADLDIPEEAAVSDLPELETIELDTESETDAEKVEPDTIDPETALETDEPEDKPAGDHLDDAEEAVDSEPSRV